MSFSMRLFMTLYVVYFQTRHAIEKVLDWENSHLYHKVSSALQSLSECQVADQATVTEISVVSQRLVYLHCVANSWFSDAYALRPFASVGACVYTEAFSFFRHILIR